MRVSSARKRLVVTDFLLSLEATVQLNGSVSDV